jgi:hypothetical protein
MSLLRVKIYGDYFESTFDEKITRKWYLWWINKLMLKYQINLRYLDRFSDYWMYGL